MGRKKKARDLIPRTKKAENLFRRLQGFKDIPPINPDFFYRLSVCPPFLGLERSQLKLKIDAGELPKPVMLSETGRGIGYYGSTLLEIKAQRIAAAKKSA